MVAHAILPESESAQRLLTLLYGGKRLGSDRPAILPEGYLILQARRRQGEKAGPACVLAFRLAWLNVVPRL